MEISDIRRENLRSLMKQHFEGKQARLADALGKSANYISRCLSTSMPASSRKNIGEDFAREIEQALGLDRYRLDTAGMAADVAGSTLNPSFRLSAIETWDDNTPLDDDEVYVPFLQEVELAAGSGRFAITESSSSRLRFFKKDLRHNNVQFNNAKCVAVSGNSMLPVLRDGATVGVNVGKNSLGDIIDGDMYAINHNGQLRVKQLYRLPSGIRLRSFNRDEHPDEDYTFVHLQEQQLSIIGHVFWWAMYSR
jgi:phage repressor protein C with HTH and peptisase S24 domain